ncbi:MAG: altronate dehydratase family protein [Anaerolineales bacterium]|nr:altronate dehydratase family protein [Anaerolineales bacterium]
MNISPDKISSSQNSLQLNPKDNVAIAKTDLQPGNRLVYSQAGEGSILVRQLIPAGHKVALKSLPCGEAVIRYGQVIGNASREISAGEHVHTHNVSPSRNEREFDFSVDAQVVQILPKNEQRTFMGFRRPDGRVGTRNYLAVIASVQCAAQVVHRIARYFGPERLKDFPNVDGVIALTPAGGCGGRPDYDILQQTLAGMAHHPNVGGAVMVGLGCEGNQVMDLTERHDLLRLEVIGQDDLLVIQALGGSEKTIQAGIQAVAASLPRVNAAQRQPQPLSQLTLALECGGSDSWSGITANPLVGFLSDEIVRQGGTVVLAETPEIFGAEHLLTRRAIRPAVGEHLLAKLEWWQDYVRRMDASFEDNPGPGNQAGGLTNICEKSLGAIAKSGSTPLMAVYDYAQLIREKGFVFMDTSGYDPVSVTGMVAGGCNLVLFTTGRGSVFGFKPAPSIKISSNSSLYRRMTSDMDFNAGRILDENLGMEVLAGELLDLVVSVAGGQPTKSDRLGLGELEFQPWSPIGPV